MTENNLRELPTPDQFLASGLRNEDEELIRGALAAGANPNGQNDDGVLLLNVARSRNINMAALLYAAGADISKSEKYADEKIRDTYRGITGENARHKEWEAEYYQKPLDWLRENNKDIGIRAVVIIGRNLTQKVADIDTRLAALEKSLVPAAIAKSKLQTPTTP